MCQWTVYYGSSRVRNLTVKMCVIHILSGIISFIPHTLTDWCYHFRIFVFIPTTPGSEISKTRNSGRPSGGSLIKVYLGVSKASVFWLNGTCSLMSGVEGTAVGCPSFSHISMITGLLLVLTNCGWIVPMHFLFLSAVTFLSKDRPYLSSSPSNITVMKKLSKNALLLVLPKNAGLTTTSYAEQPGGSHGRPNHNRCI